MNVVHLELFVVCNNTLWCLIHGGAGRMGHNKQDGRRSLSNLINGGGRNFKISVNVGNEWKKRHRCLILMLNLRVSKQTRSEVRKNKVITKRVSKILIN